MAGPELCPTGKCKALLTAAVNTPLIWQFLSEELEELRMQEQRRRVPSLHVIHSISITREPK